LTPAHWNQPLTPEKSPSPDACEPRRGDTLDDDEKKKVTDDNDEEPELLTPVEHSSQA
jgi:hypothetical protein